MTDDRGTILLTLARDAIGEQFRLPPHPVPKLPWLKAPGATFVTLTQNRQLRGCIGSIFAERALVDDVALNARGAAFRDTRFTPVKQPELAGLRVEVSLLSPLAPLRFNSEAALLEQLRPGIDGLVLDYGRRRGTFLPQVWEQLPQPQEFLAHLKEKTGLPQRFWDADVRVSRYTVEKWCEPEGS